jgi:hypothetical protein
MYETLWFEVQTKIAPFFPHLAAFVYFLVAMVCIGHIDYELELIRRRSAFARAGQKIRGRYGPSSSPDE